MDKKEVTIEAFNEFWILFDEKHLDISMQLKSKVLLNGSIFANQPAKMPKEIYDIYFRFLRRWYMDNGYIPFEPDFIYIATDDDKSMEIDTSKIVKIERVANELTKVEIKEADKINTIIIKEDFDYLKRRAYIF